MFAHWIKDRIDQYGFINAVDFTTTTNLPNRAISSGGRRTTEYHITVGMAKELAMVESDEQGNKAGLYLTK